MSKEKHSIFSALELRQKPYLQAAVFYPLFVGQKLFIKSVAAKLLMSPRITPEKFKRPWCLSVENGSLRKVRFTVALHANLDFAFVVRRKCDCRIYCPTSSGRTS